MAQNFVECDRELAFLMPPSLREWLPEDHLAWFVLEAVEEMDLTEFYADYRQDGHGRAAYEPSMMVALLLYAYATKQRSARGIEIHCRQDVGYRVIAANWVPRPCDDRPLRRPPRGGARGSVRLGARSRSAASARQSGAVPSGSPAVQIGSRAPNLALRRTPF